MSAFVHTKSDLAKRLGISRRTITNHMRDDGAPATRADGRYHVEEWQAFIHERGIVDDSEDDAKNWKNELARLKCEQIQLAIDTERKELVPMGEVLAAAGHTLSAFRNALNQLAGRCAQGVVGLRDYDEIKDFIDSEIRIILNGLQEGSFLDGGTDVIGEVQPPEDVIGDEEAPFVNVAPKKKRRAKK